MTDIAATSTSLPQTFLTKWTAQAPRLAKTSNTPEAGGESASSDNALRDRLGEFVGNVFYGTLLRQMQDSKLKGKYYHGGRGEEVFQGQMGMELARRLGRASNDPVVNKLYEAMSQQKRAQAGESSEGAG